MKQKKYFILAAAAILMAACSENDVVEKQKAPQTANDGAVVFDAYQSRGTTRAGVAGTMTIGVLKQADAGFGVFSYYTNNEGYSELAKPDFMYNQAVKFEAGNWSYAPIKYWPNEFGTEAASERVDYLTFFAYAPYVPTDPKTGKVNDIKSDETGIIALTRNTAIGDPLVKYVANFNPAQCVDLCWGVADADFSETVTTGAPTNDIKKGKPYIDVIKPKAGSKIKFNFKHALTQLNVQIDTDVDVESHNDGELDSKTRIYVRSVSFEGFTDRGTLNLNSEWDDASVPAKTTPIWYNISGDGNLSTNPVSIYDGRYDGREGVDNVAAPAELPLGLNPDIIQANPYTTNPADLSVFTSTQAGVVHTAKNLFNDATLTTPILVIPNGQNMRVKVVYDVETYDPHLATFLSDGKTHGNTIENAISQEIKLASGDPMKLEAGKKYIVKLHLGLTSVKFDADVQAWDDSAPETGEADLPINKGMYASIAASATTFNFTFAGATGSITEKTGSEKLNGAASDAITVSGTAPSGTLGLSANTTVANKNYEVTVQDATTPTPKELTINLTQKAQAFVLANPTITKGEATIDVTAGSGSGTVTDDQWATAVVTVQKSTDGTNWTDAAFTYAGGTGKGTITLGTAPAAGEYYKISVKVGDAEAVPYTSGALS